MTNEQQQIKKASIIDALDQCQLWAADHTGLDVMIRIAQHAACGVDKGSKKAQQIFERLYAARGQFKSWAQFAAAWAARILSAYDAIAMRRRYRRA